MNSAASHEMDQALMRSITDGDAAANGEFCTVDGERFYVIRGIERMAPFFVSVISADDHWLFVSSTGGLTAGRVSPDTALFPYETVDKIHENVRNTGPKTVIRIKSGSGFKYWEPFSREYLQREPRTCNLYKNTLGNKLCFEEIHHELELAFRYTWSTSAEHGFVRDCEIESLGEQDYDVDILDGLQNILPAGTPRFTQTNSSNLVDAYKWTELDPETGLAFLTLYSGITDRAEPAESLKATTVYPLGLDDPTVLLSSDQLEAFRSGEQPAQEAYRRGIRGAYFVSFCATISSNGCKRWRLVLDGEQDQADVVALRRRLQTRKGLHAEVSAAIASGSEQLAGIMAAADAYQVSAEENVSVHHYANVLFNVLRGGIFDDSYFTSATDFAATVRHFNAPAYNRHRIALESLASRVRIDELTTAIDATGDNQLRRLMLEYLPITFGRRHGDPSRPWNEFAILLKDENGDELLSYQGNWRDIFQNWEALALSYPAYIESMVAKFVNASTADGYNPYRITKEGIDWEVEEPDNPWSYIGYWGDHQIIYLLKLLELSRAFHPSKLKQLLGDRVFCYANVPYRIKSFDDIMRNPKATVVFDEALAELIEQRTDSLGADGKLILDDKGDVLLVNLLEKLLVPLLAKLSNLVVDGGIWMNTQRPEWNDANNALVGHGLSMVTLCYLRRYVKFIRELLDDAAESTELSAEVAEWLRSTAMALQKVRNDIDAGSVDDESRLDSLAGLGNAASDFRESLYADHRLSKPVAVSRKEIQAMLDDAFVAIDRSIRTNQRSDGLYHAYNIAGFRGDRLHIEHLYPMLEGQVAVLSSGVLSPTEVIDVVDALFASTIYRADQKSFMLYPDRDLPGFLERNRVPEDEARKIPLLQSSLDSGDDRLIVRDADNCLRFNADLCNVSDVNDTLDELRDELGDAVTRSAPAVLELYELVFKHRHFTGRSGTMFGFEGLGSIYWHMVSKLLLAVAENFVAADTDGVDEATLRRLGDLYYRIRSGIGFNKTPTEYGAFPTDPYSHTPRHAGARQPGMTGQVKEEILTRFIELGIRVTDGAATLRPSLLRRQEFSPNPAQLRYLDVNDDWQEIAIPASSLAFTWCQVPLVYVLDDDATSGIEIAFNDGTRTRHNSLQIPADVCAALFDKNGRVQSLSVHLTSDQLFAG